MLEHELEHILARIMVGYFIDFQTSNFVQFRKIDLLEISKKSGKRPVSYNKTLYNGSTTFFTRIIV